jgi:predicted transposase/invertase (TIGR01784 family)
LERISQDDILRRKALNRTLEIADKLQLKKEAKEAREEGIKDTKEQIVKKLINMNLSVQQIAKAVQLSENEVEKILNTK